MTDTTADTALQTTTAMLVGRGYLEFDAKLSYVLKRADRAFQRTISDAYGIKYHITLWGYGRNLAPYRAMWTWTAEVVTRHPWFTFEQPGLELQTTRALDPVEDRAEVFFFVFRCQPYSRPREAAN